MSPRPEDPIGEVVDLHRRTAADELLTRQLRALAGGEAGTADDPADGIVGDPDALLRRLGPALPRPPKALRIAIAVVAALQLGAVLPWLFDRDPLGLLGQSSAEHLTRDGALGLAVASAALLAAWRPRYAVPCGLICLVALLAQAASAVFERHAPSANELVHLPSLVLTCLVGLSVVRLGALGPRSRPGHRRP